MALINGHGVICCDRNRRGGLKRIFLMDKDALGVVAHASATNMYTSFMTTALYEFQFDRATGGFDAAGSRENGSTVVSVQLNFYIPKVTPKVNKTLDMLAGSCGLIAVVETYADDCGTPALGAVPAVPAATYHFVLGYDEIFQGNAYLDFVSGEETTGVALQDANGAQVALGGEAAMYPIGLLVGTGGVMFTQTTAGVEFAWEIKAHA